MARPSLALLVVGSGVACADPAADPLAGELWVADPLAGTLSAWDVATGEPRGPVVELGADARPSALAVSERELWVGDFGTGRIERWSLPDRRRLRALHENGPTGVRIEEPCAMRRAGDELYVLANDSWNLVVFGPRGDVRRQIGLDPPLVAGHAFEVLDDGAIVVGTSPVWPDLGLVQVWGPDDGARLDAFALYPELSEATAVVRVGDDLVVADWFTGALTVYDAGGAVVGTLAEGLDHPVAAQVGPDGDLWVLTASAVVAVGADGDARTLVDGRGAFEMPRNFVFVPGSGERAPSGVHLARDR